MKRCLGFLPLAMVLLSAAACGDSTISNSQDTSTSVDAFAATDASGADGVATTDISATLDGSAAVDVVVPAEPDAVESTGVTPPAVCQAPASLPADPLTLLGSVSPQLPPKPNGSQGQKHLVEIFVGPEDGLLYTGGLPSLVILEDTGGEPTTLGSVNGRIEHLTWAGAGRVALTSRGHSSKPGGGGGGGGNKEPGVYIVDVSAPGSPAKVGFTGLEDSAGLVATGELLQILTHVGSLHTFDISGGGDPVEVHELTGFGNPWTLAVEGAWGYVADNSKGLVVVDFAVPEAPVLGPFISTLGGAQDVSVDQGIAYLALGSRGIEAFDLSDPALPVSVGSIDVGMAVINVAASEGLVWYTTQESVGVVDCSDPTAMVSLGVEDTPSWAMAVDAVGSRGYVADWKSVEVYEIDPGVVAPDAALERDEFYFAGATTEMTVSLDNRGAAPLEIVGIRVDDPRVSVSVDALEVAPGESIDVRLVFDADGAPLDTTLCLATNDPDESVQTFPVATASSDPNSMVGEAAPDFNLADLDGAYHQLSQEQGKPVVLCYFATW